MSSSYLPQKDADLQNWVLNFKTLIAANPTTYGLKAADATAITSLYTAWNAAYVLVTSPTTKTAATVAAKNIARTNMNATYRSYAQNIANNAGVTSANKIALGLNPRTSIPTPVAAPVTYPLLAFPSTLSNGIVLRFRDELASPSVKAKPPGVTGLELHVGLADPGTSGANIAAMPLAAIKTKSPDVIDTTAIGHGVPIWVAARWITRRGLTGPFSSVTALHTP